MKNKLVNTILMMIILSTMIFFTACQTHYTEIKLGMSKENLIELIGEPEAREESEANEEKDSSKSSDNHTLTYSDNQFEEDCTAKYRFSSDRLRSIKYFFDNTDLDASKVIYDRIKSELMDEYGKIMIEENSFLGENVYTESESDDWENEKRAFTTWKIKKMYVIIFLEEESFSVMYRRL